MEKLNFQNHYFSPQGHMILQKSFKNADFVEAFLITIDGLISKILWWSERWKINQIN